MRTHARATLVLILILALSACAGTTPTTAPTAAPAAAPTTAPAEPAAQPDLQPTTAPAPTTAPDSQAAYTEAPALAEMVEAGKLPPVEERLPTNPLVIEPLGEIGTYGGDFRFPFQGNNVGWGGVYFITGWEGLLAWTPDFQGLRPNVAERWEVSDDGMTYTFYLREGMRWSDGVPFTTDDIMFYIEEIVLNEEINASGSADWIPPGVTITTRQIDDQAFSITFSEPNGLFLAKLAQWDGRAFTFYPKHYLQQFHQKYNPDGIDALVKADSSVSDWVGLFQNRAVGITGDFQDYFNQPERPVLFPWVVTQPLGTGTQAVLERNPYYFKVDPAGNQLPYIDRVVATSFQDQETMTLAILNGDFDIVHNPRAEDRTLFHESMEKAGLAIYYPTVDGSNVASIHFNQTAKDPTLAEVFADKDFRIGMSHAIDRLEVIDILYAGEGEPWQLAPLADSPLYNEQLAKQYTEFDPALANEHLDKVLPEKDADGYRLGPDGKRFSFALTVVDEFGQPYVKLGELLVGYWKEVGVEAKLNVVDSQQRDTIRNENDIEGAIFTGEGGAGITGILDARYYVPGGYHSLWVNGYGLHYNQPNQPGVVEPDAFTEEQRAAFARVMAEPELARQVELMKPILQTAADEFYAIGIATPGSAYQPFNARIRNIPETWTNGWIEGVHKLILPEQWFIAE